MEERTKMQFLFEVKAIMPPSPEPVYNSMGDAVFFKDVLLPGFHVEAEICCDQVLRKIVDVDALKEKLRVTVQDFFNTAYRESH